MAAWDKDLDAPVKRPAWERDLDQPAAPATAQPSGGLKQQLGNLVAGAVRGAGSIGATVLTPIDMAARALGVQNDFIGRDDRRQAMDGGLQAMGAETDSLAYGAGKIGAEVAGTLGVGGAVANAAARLPGVAAAVPNLLNATRTAGMTGGNLATRAAGGALTGGASAALVNPDDVATGAAVGAALPGALKLAGGAGQAVGKLIRGPDQAPELAAAVKSAQAAGYVIPPTQAKPTLLNRLGEGLAGKISTAQNASAKNQAVTNRLAADALGLPADTKITPDVLKTVRDTAGQAYAALGGVGTITPGPAYMSALDAISAPALKAAQGFPNAKASPVIELVDSLRSPSFDAASAIAKVKELRAASDDAFRTGNTDVARASKSAAKVLEDVMEAHLQQTGNTALLTQFRDARKLIAKTYTVEKALNPASGSVDARRLAADLKKGKPLTDELRTAAEFASQFPKAAQAVEGMGSLPQTSPLDWAAAGGISAATSNPLFLAITAARPVARAAILSGPVQRRLVQQPANSAVARLFTNPRLQEIGYRGAPVLAVDQ